MCLVHLCGADSRQQLRCFCCGVFLCHHALCTFQCDVNEPGLHRCHKNREGFVYWLCARVSVCVIVHVLCLSGTARRRPRRFSSCLLSAAAQEYVKPSDVCKMYGGSSGHREKPGSHARRCRAGWRL